MNINVRMKVILSKNEEKKSLAGGGGDRVMRAVPGKEALERCRGSL